MLLNVLCKCYDCLVDGLLYIYIYIYIYMFVCGVLVGTIQVTI